ncbi:T9SS type A sorting domain-containing protein [bacterium SCSIO 12741]|nr:T9SS type A sorting domain-containing protein [bacterium SCSIO 12741]
MKKKLVFTLLVFLGLTAVIVKANHKNGKQGKATPHQVKVTIVEDNNGQINKSEEIVDVTERGDLQKYLKSKNIDLKEMEVYKKGGGHGEMRRMHSRHDVWVFNRSGDHPKSHVMVIAEADDDNFEGAIEEKVMIQKIEIHDDEGEVENQEIRVEKTVDDDGNVTVKKYVNGKEVDPDTKVFHPRSKVKMMEDGEEMEIIVETSDEEEPKTIKIKKEVGDDGEVKVYKSVNGSEFKEVQRGEHKRMRWEEKGRQHPGFAARSKDGSTMVFVTPVKDESSAKTGQVMSTEQTLELNEVKFYPNPSSGKFSLSFNTPQEGSVKITVTDLQGKEVMTQEFKNWNGTQEFELNESEAGMYLVKIEQNGQVYSHRLVIH